MDKLFNKLIRFLEFRNWVFQKETSKYLIYISPKSIANGKLKIKVATDFSKNDYGRVLVNILTVLTELYPSKKDRLRLSIMAKQASAIDLKWQKKENWILFADKSKIKKHSIYDIYIPKFTWL